MKDKAHKYIYSLFVKPFIKRKIKKETVLFHGGLDLVVFPGVFHPQYMFSTLFFCDYIAELDMRGKTFCEVGTGCGAVSLQAYRAGAEIFSFDISEKAISNTEENFKLNFTKQKVSKFHLYKSDLFDNVPQMEFDFIFINPPYFFKDVKNEEEKAWYCGKNGEYFKKLFYQLPEHSHANSSLLMVLAENCDIKRIEKLAKYFGYELHLIHKKKIKWEWNFLYSLHNI